MAKKRSSSKFKPMRFKSLSSWKKAVKKLGWRIERSPDNVKHYAVTDFSGELENGGEFGGKTGFLYIDKEYLTKKVMVKKNPVKRKKKVMSSIEARKFFDNLYAKSQAEEELFRSTDAGREQTRKENEERLAKYGKKNPAKSFYVLKTPHSAQNLGGYWTGRGTVSDSIKEAMKCDTRQDAEKTKFFLDSSYKWLRWTIEKK